MLLSSALCINYYQKLLKSALLDSFYYQFANSSEYKALKGINRKNKSSHLKYRRNILYFNIVDNWFWILMGQ